MADTYYNKQQIDEKLKTIKEELIKKVNDKIVFIDGSNTEVDMENNELAFNIISSDN